MSKNIDESPLSMRNLEKNLYAKRTGAFANAEAMKPIEDNSPKWDLQRQRLNGTYKTLNVK